MSSFNGTLNLSGNEPHPDGSIPAGDLLHGIYKYYHQDRGDHWDANYSLSGSNWTLRVLEFGADASRGASYSVNI